jgi:hypothetical protein
MGETGEGLAILARIPSRGRDDDGMEYGPHVVAAIRGEALASLERFGEAADVVLDAIRSDGVLEADVGELVHWLLLADRSPAEITAALCAEDLVPMLGRVLRQPPPLADVLLDGAWARFPDRLEPLAAAASVAPRLPLARALVWSARLRQRGLATSCPLLAIGRDAGIDPVVRARAAAALYGSFHDMSALDIARAALGDLDPAARLASEEEIGRLAPTLLSALTGTSRPSMGTVAATGTNAATRLPAPVPSRPATGSTTCLQPTRKDSAVVLRAAPTTKRGGVNIVGPFEGTSVEADVARRLASALRAGDVAIATTSYHRDHRDLGSAWSHHGSSDFPFDVNLLVVHPDDMTDFVLDSGPGLFHNRYTIGLWVWDLQVPSPSMTDAARMVHEVWTPTSWGYRSASTVFGGPVHGVPIPVGGEPTRMDRAALDLPDGLVFACSVDFDSGFARQNPLGAVKAYTGAFSPSDGHHLVIDASHADRYPREHALLVGLADGRPDVAIRHGLSAAERDRLLAEADCYLSLHRADGGLGSVAKAMSWGTFTVVTATPESLEFQSDEDSGLVHSETVAVPVDEYRYPTGSSWADPDLEHAGSLLQSVVDDPDATAIKVRWAREVATRRFAPSAAVGAVRSRLADIDARLHAGHRRDRVAADKSRGHAGQRR